jgi:hypothetical protein
MEIKKIRELGIGSNFRVINPKDGYRKDNHLWFGECENCGQYVASSLVSKFQGWTHWIELESIGLTGKRVVEVDYCPKG